MHHHRCRRHHHHRRGPFNDIISVPPSLCVCIYCLLPHPEGVCVACCLIVYFSFGRLRDSPHMFSLSFSLFLPFLYFSLDRFCHSFFKSFSFFVSNKIVLFSLFLTTWASNPALLQRRLPFGASFAYPTSLNVPTCNGSLCSFIYVHS